MIQTYPLAWPTDWPRTPEYQRGAGPNQMPSSRARQLLLRDLEMMRATAIVVSSNVESRRDGMPYANQKKIDDPGVVLYFHRKGQDIAIPRDRWTTVDANLRAIGLQIESIRRIERWGTDQMLDRAFTGYAALPAGKSNDPEPWYQVLGVDVNSPRSVIIDAYKTKAKRYHPDNQETGDPEIFKKVRQAYEDGTL